MRLTRIQLSAAFVCASMLTACVSSTADSGLRPITRAHAHNDYEHPHPLYDALDQGFCSVEADIHLVNGELLVAHDRKNVNPARTLETLYLKPLRSIVKGNHGHVYGVEPEFILLID